MITDTQKRQQIVQKIYKLPFEKLKEVESLILKLSIDSKLKAKNLSYAGAWKDIDDSIIDEFTTQLIHKRQINNRRMNE
jgi:hypothetical protein